MAIYVSDKGGGTFTPHPEGQFAARCIDVVDVGWVKTDYGPKYKVRFVFFCDETDSKEIEGEGRRTHGVAALVHEGCHGEPHGPCRAAHELP